MPQTALAPVRFAPSRSPTAPTHVPVEPFRGVEQAWFWTMNALQARHSGARSSRGTTRRPCDPDDIVKCLDRLYRNRRIDLGHARVLRIWGERRVAPNGKRASEYLDAVLWHEAMERLAWPLRMKGFVV